MTSTHGAGTRLTAVDPTTGRSGESYRALTLAELDGKVATAAATFADYRRTTFGQRRKWLLRAAEIFVERADELAGIATAETGKTLRSARAEVEKCAAGAEFYASNAERFMLDEPAEASRVGASRAYVRWQPLGPVLAIMPWNYPFWQVVRFAAPALMAGNIVLLKHAANVPGCASALQSVFTDAGFPAGAFQALLVGSHAVADLIADRRIAAITLTGSEAAGRAVGAAAGAHIKKVVLELGGSDPFVVLPSADIVEAARIAAMSRFQNCGQSCIAAKRFIVHRDCARDFVDAFIAQAQAMVVGDPRHPGTDLGPLATERGRADIDDLVRDAEQHGGQIRCGGTIPGGPGWFYPATIVTGVTPQMRLYTEEAFGPVAAVITVDSVEQAVTVANDTDFGLGANVWTRDPLEQERLIQEIDAGAVFINGMTASFPQLPFGGIKHSGHGRELAAAGLREFCNAKTVWQA